MTTNPTERTRLVRSIPHVNEDNLTRIFSNTRVCKNNYKEFPKIISQHFQKENHKWQPHVNNYSILNSSRIVTNALLAVGSMHDQMKRIPANINKSCQPHVGWCLYVNFKKKCICQECLVVSEIDASSR